MIFPKYVPTTVIRHIQAHLEGDDWEPTGWLSVLASANKKLKIIEQDISEQSQINDLESLTLLRKKKADALYHRDYIAKEVDCFYRLLNDPRMEEVYISLSEIFKNDYQLPDFIHAAWVANMDFSKFRERIKKVSAHSDKIAKTSEKLSKLLIEIDGFGYDNWPSELFGVAELLRTTDNHKMNSKNLSMWRSMRVHILGDEPSRDNTDKKATKRPSAIQWTVNSGDEARRNQEEETRRMLHYAWGTAPDLSEILKTVTKAAKSFIPAEDGIIGDAIASREQNLKNEFIRAFIAQLKDKNKLLITEDLQKAMAIVANVIINHPDIDVTIKDIKDMHKHKLAC